ncbi:hypothetical protein SASPL_156852 [Salvia splendens]|uniref:NAC domain-containing protein n=1 Tax=Salvia splendens TaxID=180675 RepID=A0A8X8VVX6_SALSN|nr:hypothetical protein SASPL_156852 [Salvia splendens]
MEIAVKKNSFNTLEPGFRFHPTDEELVRYYLRRKVCGRGFRISDIDIYKAEPWDLPRFDFQLMRFILRAYLIQLLTLGFSKLKTRDLEWYFFSVLDRKYGNGARTNRATEKGYWKTTGKDRAVYHRGQIVGMKKTLVYHIGRAPKGQRTNWVMHEYRLTDLELERAGIHQYGAPFVEEEWLGDDSDLIPKAEAAEEVDLGMMLIWTAMILSSEIIPGAALAFCYCNGNLNIIVVLDNPSADSPLQSNCQPTDGSSFVDETAESVDDGPKLLLSAGDQYCEPEQHKDNHLYDIPAPFDMDVRAVKHEFIGESSKSEYSDDLDFLLDEPFQENPPDLPYGSASFIEASDLSHPIETDTSPASTLEEFFTFYDAKVGGEQSTLPSAQPLNNNNGDAGSSSDKLDSSTYESDFKYPFLKQASQMLGSMPAPPALAAEFPSKGAVHRLNSLSQPSTSVHVTAGMIQIRNLSADGNGVDKLLSKPTSLNIVLSFGYSRGEDGSAHLESSLQDRELYMCEVIFSGNLLAR